MRTYENLVKRINLVESAYNKVEKNKSYANAVLAVRMQLFLKQSYLTLFLNGIKIEEEEK